jgi:hypothetical protein
MADLIVAYTLSTGAGTIVFNNGNLKDGTDKYWIQTINGLDGPVIRAPVDNRPMLDGGIVHDFWKGPRHPVFNGVILIESVSLDGCQGVRDDMEDDLRDALDSILRADGTLSWTPTNGGGTRSLTVRYEVPVDFQPIEDYALDSFTFGLIAADPDW